MNTHQPDLLAETPGDDVQVDPEIMLERILADPGLVQHTVRMLHDDCETVVGYFRCTFSAGQQRFVLHLPFSPSLTSVPTVEALVTEQADVRTRVTDRQKYGTRIEIILPAPSLSEQSLLVEVIATSEVSN